MSMLKAGHNIEDKKKIKTITLPPCPPTYSLCNAPKKLTITLHMILYRTGNPTDVENSNINTSSPYCRDEPAPSWHPPPNSRPILTPPFPTLDCFQPRCNANVLVLSLALVDMKSIWNMESILDTGQYETWNQLELWLPALFSQSQFNEKSLQKAETFWRQCAVAVVSIPSKPGINTKHGIDNVLKHEISTKEHFKQGGWKARYPKYRNASTPESRFCKRGAVPTPHKQLRQNTNGELQQKRSFREAKSIQETPLEHLLCSEVINSSCMLEIPDLEQIGMETKRGQHKTSNKKDWMNENSN